MKHVETQEVNMERMIKNFKRALKKNIFYKTKVVNLGISDICNYTSIHPQCPTSKMKKNIMPLAFIEKIAKKLGESGYDRLLSPYGYSEPLIDPRFYVILDILRKNVPNARLGFISNGFFLYETIMDDVIERGVSHIQTTAYFADEYDRLNKLKIKIKKKYPSVLFRVIKGFPLRKRMCDKYSIYGGEPNNSKLGCRAPYRYVHISSYGDVILCCNDWKGMVSFGNLKDKTLEEIFLSNKMMKMGLNLLMGNREKYFLCSRCYRNK